MVKAREKATEVRAIVVAEAGVRRKARVLSLEILKFTHCASKMKVPCADNLRRSSLTPSFGLTRTVYTIKWYQRPC